MEQIRIMRRLQYALSASEHTDPDRASLGKHHSGPSLELMGSCITASQGRHAGLSWPLPEISLLPKKLCPHLLSGGLWASPGARRADLSAPIAFHSIRGAIK